MAGAEKRCCTVEYSDTAEKAFAAKISWRRRGEERAEVISANDSGGLLPLLPLFFLLQGGGLDGRSMFGCRRKKGEEGKMEGKGGRKEETGSEKGRGSCWIVHRVGTKKNWMRGNSREIFCPKLLFVMLLMDESAVCETPLTDWHHFLFLLLVLGLVLSPPPPPPRPPPPPSLVMRGPR